MIKRNYQIRYDSQKGAYRADQQFQFWFMVFPWKPFPFSDASPEKVIRYLEIKTGKTRQQLNIAYVDTKL